MKTKVFQFLLRTVGKALPVSYHPFGRQARKFRYFCAKNIVKEIGTGCNIEKGAMLNSEVVIDDHGGVGVNCLISPGTRIGKHVMMGPECLIFTNNHRFDRSQLKFDGYTERRPVVIGDHAWIGARCIILPGVTIGKGSIVGAGSVVTKDIPDYCVAAGNPAKVVKKLEFQRD